MNRMTIHTCTWADGYGNWHARVTMPDERDRVHVDDAAFKRKSRNNS